MNSVELKYCHHHPSKSTIHKWGEAFANNCTICTIQQVGRPALLKADQHAESANIQHLDKRKPAQEMWLQYVLATI